MRSMNAQLHLPAGLTLLRTTPWLALLMSTSMHAGPPLIIDDPDILDPGELQFIIAADGQGTDSVDVFELPNLDLEVGITSRSELSIELPYTIENPAAASSRHGFGFASVGYKLQFLSTPNTQMAIEPGYSWLVTNSLLEGVSDDGSSVVSLPLLCSRRVGDVTVLSQLAWYRASGGDRAWDYGVAVMWPERGSTQLMTELYGAADRSLDQRELVINFGLDHEFEDKMHLLAAVGTHLARSTSAVEKLRYRVYIGLEWFF